MHRDIDSKVIGYFAFSSPTEVICEVDACVISGSEQSMRNYIVSTSSGSSQSTPMRKTRFDEITIGMKMRALYAFDEQSYNRFYLFANKIGLNLKEEEFFRRNGNRTPFYRDKVVKINWGLNMPTKGFIPNKLRPWVEAPKKYHLSHAQIQMARELGLNPKKFGGMANLKQECWKMPLPDYIEHLFEKRFGKKLPDDTRSVEVRDAQKRRRKAQNRANKSNHEKCIT